MVGSSLPLREAITVLRLVAPRHCTILITGRTGTGKELAARAIHQASARNQRDMVSVNCGAIPADLVEAEFFGHVKGAFTGAVTARPGRFEQADGGTLFLDEVGELPAEMQAKLLRALQEGEFQRVGSSETVRVDVRIIAATNRDLGRMVERSQFREDLYYRLNVIDVRLPPLRNRVDDILPIAEHLLAQHANKVGLAKPIALSPETQRVLLSYRWPGNVREMQNTIERGIALCQGGVIEPADLPQTVHHKRDIDYLAPAVARHLSIAELERDFILLVLDDEGGNKTRTAQRLGLDRKTLYRKLEEFAKQEKS